MTTRSFAEVRQDIQTAVDAIAGFWPAPVPFDGFGPNAVPNAIPATRGHLAFSVGIPSSRAADDRQRPSDGLLVQSTVGVKFLARIAPKGQIASVDAGFDAEVLLISKILAVGSGRLFHVAFDGSSRSTPGGGEWRLHDVRFTLYHRVSI